MRFLIALIGEIFFRGSTGSVETGSKVDHQEPLHVVLVKIVISILALLLANFILFRFFLAATQQTILSVAVFHVVYFVIAFFFHPIPDESELGWGGTILDDPLSLSDDVNRSLLFLQYFLLPGRFISEGIVVLFSRIFGGRR